MKTYHLGELIEFSPEAHSKSVYFESKKLKAQVMGLEPGQQIPPCRMEFDVVFFVMEGEGKIVVDEQEEELKKFAWVFVPKEKETRSITAETRMKLLAIQVRC